MRLYIPTYRRVRDQHTWELLPPSLRRRTRLIVHPDELAAHLALGRPAVACPVQGNIARVREWIIRNAHAVGHKRIGILDDDIRGLVYTTRPMDKTPETPWAVPADLDIWRGACSWVSATLDNHVTCSWGVSNTVPLDGDVVSPWRGWITHFFDLTRLPIDELDFTAIDYAEDFALILQLISLGYPNAVSRRYRIAPTKTDAPGGCQAQGRDRDSHNRAMQALIERYHPWVRQSSGYRGKPRPGAEDWIKVTIRWQAYWKHVQSQMGKGDKGRCGH